MSWDKNFSFWPKVTLAFKLWLQKIAAALWLSFENPFENNNFQASTILWWLSKRSFEFLMSILRFQPTVLLRCLHANSLHHLALLLLCVWLFDQNEFSENFFTNVRGRYEKAWKNTCQIRVKPSKVNKKTAVGTSPEFVGLRYLEKFRGYFHVLLSPTAKVLLSRNCRKTIQTSFVLCKGD